MTQSVEIPLPGGSFTNWAAMTVHLCGVPSEVPTPTETNWQDWGRSFMVTSPVVAYQLPDPSSFVTWQDWVVGVKRTVSGA
mgnify:FL=1